MTHNLRNLAPPPPRNQSNPEFPKQTRPQICKCETLFANNQPRNRADSHLGTHPSISLSQLSPTFSVLCQVFLRLTICDLRMLSSRLLRGCLPTSSLLRASHRLLATPRLGTKAHLSLSLSKAHFDFFSRPGKGASEFGDGSGGEVRATDLRHQDHESLQDQDRHHSHLDLQVSFA